LGDITVGHWVDLEYTPEKCERCGEKLVPESSVIFQKTQWSISAPAPAGTAKGVEWKQTAWKKRERTKKAEFLQDGIIEEIFLCSVCGQKFKEEIEERESRENTLTSIIFLLLPLIILLVALYILFWSK
jgi:DNA-directed RNA polymerase subunit RPC12/RpoP